MAAAMAVMTVMMGMMAAATVAVAVVMVAAMAVMTVAVVMAAAMAVMTVAVVAEMKTGFLSKSPPQLPSAKHPAFTPARMLTLLTQTRT